MADVLSTIMTAMDTGRTGKKRLSDSFDATSETPPAKIRRVSYDDDISEHGLQDQTLDQEEDAIGGAEPDKPFRLLDLPTEVRLEIYRACITRPFNIMLSKQPTPTNWDENDVVDMYNRPRRRSPRLRACNTTQEAASATSPGGASSTVTPRKPKPQDADPLLVNILLTCQLVYREARPVLYGENKFDIELDTARSTLAALHQRSRGNIHALRLSIPAGNDALERFAELVRLGLRYCWRLRTFTIKLTSAFESGSHANIYGNAFDNLRWLPKDCKVVLEGHIDPEVEKVVQLKAALAKSLDEAAYARRQLMSSDKSYPLFAVEGFGRKPLQSPT